MSFQIQTPNASPFGDPANERPRAKRQQPSSRPSVAPSPGGYQQGSGYPQSDSYFPPQPTGIPNMQQQQPQAGYGAAPYDARSGMQDLTSQLGSMSVENSAAPPTTRRKKDRHAYHQLEQPAGPGQAFSGTLGGQALNEQVQPHGQGMQPWQSQQLPSSATFQHAQAQTSVPAPGTGINLDGGGSQQGTMPGANGNKVNAEMIPSVPTSRDIAAEHYKTQLYPTMEQRVPPPAMVQFVAYDQGNSSPKHARLTMNTVPSSHEQLLTTALPLGLVVQPLARQDGESDVPILDFGETGPPRCRRCRAYVNPFMVFANGGNRMMCNLCGHPNEVSPEYFAPTDPSGVRVDRQDRPELLLGTCDFLVPKEYWSKEPVGMRYLFLLDVSAESCTRGFLKAMCDGLLITLYGEDLENGESTEEEEETPRPTKVPAGAHVGFMTFDREIHFYNVGANLSTPQQLVMSDLEDPFSVISPQHFFVDAGECKTNIVSLLQRLPGMFEQIRHAEPALFPSLVAALSTLSDSGGKIVCSLASLPTFGPGRLAIRDRGLQTATNDHPEQEKVLLRTENQTFKKLQADMVKAGVGVDFFLNAPAGGYLDIATIGLVAEKTGGETYYFPNWSYPRDTLKLTNELTHTVQRTQGYAALMKVRCSNGLQIAQYSGNFTQHTFGADLEMGVFTEDSTVAVTFNYDGKVSFRLNPAASVEERRRATRVELDVKTDAYFQSALLYTSPSGQRRVRCTNTVASISPTARDSMRHLDQDAILTLLAKSAAMRIPERTSLGDTRQALQDKLTDILAAYRRHHAGTHHPSTQLVMPENLKEFAMLVLGLLKSRALKGGREPSDRRVAELRALKGMSPAQVSLYVYPRIIALHNLEPGEGFADENGQLRMPRGVRASFANIDEGGAYLVDDGRQCLLWLHQLVSPNLLEDLFGSEFTSLQSLDANMNRLPVLDTLLNAQVRNIILSLESVRGAKIALQIARQGLDGSEFEFARLLFEDRNGEASSYVDWLVLLHRGVSTELSGQGRSKSGVSGASGAVAGVADGASGVVDAVSGAVSRVTGGKVW